MIISRTPLRISLVGGGSDLPSFYRQNEGAVLSFSIRKYIYLSVHEYFNSSGFILKYSRNETPETAADIQHKILRQVFMDLDVKGVDFNSSADVPAGTGMGSSSSFTVGLLNLCHAYQGRYVSRERLAELACEVEIDKLGEPIGKQDQYGCALGGINLIEFWPDDTVTHQAVPLNSSQKQALEDNLSLYYMGGTRSASAILAKQSANSARDQEVIENLKAMVTQARTLRGDICRNIDVVGEYLHEGWQRKKRLASGISSSEVDKAYEMALAAGASGGKLLGAGGSGFLLVYSPKGQSEAVAEALKSYQRHKVVIDNSGAIIIYAD